MRIRNDGYRWVIKWILTISMLSLVCSTGINFFSLFKSPLTNELNNVDIFDKHDMSKKTEDQVRTSRFRVSDNKELVSSAARLVTPSKRSFPEKEDDEYSGEGLFGTEEEQEDVNLDEISEKDASTDSFETYGTKQKNRIVTIEEEEQQEETNEDNREELNFIDMEVKREINQGSNVQSSIVESFEGDVSARLRERYGISEDQQKGCVARVNERLGDSFWSKSTNIHDQLQSAIEDLAIVTSCATTREFIIYQTPHFSGGRQQFRRYFVARGWTGTPPGKLMNKSVFDDPLDTTVAVITPCLHSIPFAKVAKQVDVISYSPKELENALKIPFYRGIRTLFDRLQCDYRTFHPESHLLETSEECQFLLQTLRKELNRQQENRASNNKPPMWFFKDRRDSFGSGVTVKNTEEALNSLQNCRSLTSKLFVQRGVENVMSYHGRTTQGRSYFLISNYEPATVWLFLGYFNVAAASQSASEDPETGQPSKSAYVTNMRTNQKSLRLLLAQLLEGRPKKDLITVKRNIKQAALTAFLALRPRLGKPKPSFSIFGFDFLVQNDLNVKVLETNCNCELFINEEHHGKQRVAISTHLVTGAMDIVIASKLNPPAFKSLLESYVKENTDNGDRFRSDEESVGTDLSKSEPHKSWELLYSEAVEPTFSIMNLEQDCVKMHEAETAETA